MSDIRKAIMARLGEFARDAGKTTADLIREAQKLRDQMKTDATEANKQRMRQIKSELDSRGVLMPYGADQMMSRPGAKAAMAKWTVTPTKKHGKDIEEHTAKIGRDHWKIDTMPHLGKNVGSLYRWDEMRGLRHISTGNIEQLKRQAEAISTKQDDLSDVMRGFSRPGAKAAFANEEAQMRELMGQLGQKPDKVIYKYGAFEMHFYGRAGKGDGEQRARRTLANLHAFMRRTGLDTHGAYYQPIDDRDPSQGGMIVLLASTFDKSSRPGAKARFATNPDLAKWVQAINAELRNLNEAIRSSSENRDDPRGSYHSYRREWYLLKGLLNMVQRLDKRSARESWNTLDDVSQKQLTKAVPSLVAWLSGKSQASRPGAKVQMGLLDRIRTVATAAVSAATAKPFDPTNPQVAKDLEAAKRAAITEVNNYKFFKDFNDAQFKALDDYVKATAKSIAGLRSSQDVVRLTNGIKQAVEARNLIRKTLKTPFSRSGAKAAFDRRIEVDHWTSPKGTKYVAGVHERGGGTSFQPFISATYSDGGEQLMTGNAPTFKTEKGARKWLDTEIGRRKSVSSRSGAKAAMAIPNKWQSEDRYVDQRAQQADEPNAPSFKQGKYIAYVHYRDRSVQVDNMLRRTPPGQYRDELEAYLDSVKQKISKYRASRLGAKAKFGSKRTTAGALRKQLKAQGMTEAAELEWHGISASDPDSTPYWLHEDGSMEKIKASREGSKATMGKYWVEDGQSNVKQPVKSMREGIQLVSGMQNGVLRYADHGMTSILAYGRGSGGASLTEDGKLHQKHASSRDGAKATFAFPGIVVKEDARYIYYYPDEDDRATFADADGKGAYTVKSNRTGKPVSAKTYRSWDEAVSASNAMNEKLPPLKKRKGFSRPGAKSTNALSDACWQGYEAVGTKKQDGKTVPNCVPKATAAKPESQDIESEEVKAGLKLMEKADEKVSEKIRTLIKEGKPQDQAVAIALDMKRRGEL